MVLRNNTRDWIEIRKGTPVTRMVTTNQVPPVIDTISTERPKEQPTLMEPEQQALLPDKLDLSGLEAWPMDQAEKAHSLLQEYHDIFSLEKHDMGHTHVTRAVWVFMSVKVCLSGCVMPCLLSRGSCRTVWVN